MHGFRVHVKLIYRIVSYRNCIPDGRTWSVDAFAADADPQS